jgi:hypothetical protein
MESSLKALAAHGGQLQQAIAADQRERPATLPMNWGEGDGARTSMDFQGIAFETYLSTASGSREIRWLGTPKLYPGLPVWLGKPSLHLQRPKAYWVPVTKTDVISRLKIHGIRLETLAEAKTVALEMYRLVNPKRGASESSHPFESRHTLKAGVHAEKHTVTFPAGSVRVETDQALGDLAIALLEPESDDSLFAWGFFLEVLQRTEYIEGYVVAPMAEKMLAGDPKLKADFEAKLAADQAFANDPAARLQWFYERSPFYDERFLLYPVGIER